MGGRHTPSHGGARGPTRVPKCAGRSSSAEHLTHVRVHVHVRMRVSVHVHVHVWRRVSVTLSLAIRWGLS